MQFSVHERKEKFGAKLDELTTHIRCGPLFPHDQSAKAAKAVVKAAVKGAPAKAAPAKAAAVKKTVSMPTLIRKVEPKVRFALRFWSLLLVILTRAMKRAVACLADACRASLCRCNACNFSVAAHQASASDTQAARARAGAAHDAGLGFSSAPERAQDNVDGV